MRVPSLLWLSVVAALGSSGCFFGSNSNPQPTAECRIDSDCGAGAACSAGTCVAVVVDHHGGIGGAVPSNAVSYRILPGASTVVQPGNQAGYGITANVGGSYRIVWTGDSHQSGSYREFWGSVWTQGRFSNIVPGCNGNICALESGDYVGSPVAAAGGQRIDFDTFATDGLDGFDFVVDTEPVYFDMVIDGQRYPQLVFFENTDTQQTANPGTMPFGLITR